MRVLPLESSPFPCGYFDDREALYEHYLIVELNDAERQALLELGYRSFGTYYFRPACQGCQRCVPLRVPLRTFKASKSQRRVLNRCADVTVKVGVPQYSEDKYRMYQEHRQRFGKTPFEEREAGFKKSFYEADIGTLEFSYYLGSSLIAVGIVNETSKALSSVYFFYQLKYSPLSLGTFSVLKEVEYGQRQGKDHLYLGYWIQHNHFMRYKAEFRPNEILGSNGRWGAYRDQNGQYLQEASALFHPFSTPLKDLPRS